MGLHGGGAAYAGRVRVVAGVAGGRRLQVPGRSGAKLRPTSERVREALFASLGSLDAIEGATVLDLFAGTGALGIEALSRGAASATFVERDAAAIDAIKANLQATGLAAHARVVRDDALRFLAATEESYDLVLADPPYDFEDWPTLLGRLKATLIALESNAEIDPGPAWTVVRARRYGDTTVTLARST
jgi:16S rRNA (guanine966-N2)-methyltransferase